MSKEKFKAMDQAVAQTIVFSFLQKEVCPNIYFVPNILISPNEFRIIMYDAENDILICSQPLYIFTEADSDSDSISQSDSESQTSRSLNKSSIIILWMVLHYEMFSTNLQPEFTEKRIDMNKFQAKFKETVKTKLDIYRNDLFFCKKKLKGTNEYFPRLKDLEDSLSEDVFKTT